MEITYEGELRFRMRTPSGVEILMDTPAEYGGKGEMPGPMDMVAASLGSCVLSLIAIFAQRAGIDLKGATVKVEKKARLAPHLMIGEIVLDFYFPSAIAPDLRAKFEKAVHACPVYNSLHPDIKIQTAFHYPQ